MALPSRSRSRLFSMNDALLPRTSHSTAEEKRYFCFGWVEDGVLTVRFAWRNERIRIFGAGYWRKGKKVYERENKEIHRR